MSGYSLSSRKHRSLPARPRPLAAALAGLGFATACLAPAPFAVAAEIAPPVHARERDLGPLRLAQAWQAERLNDAAGIAARSATARAKATIPITVDSALDTGGTPGSSTASPMTLRQALNYSSTNCYGNDFVIGFNIPGAGPQTIATNIGFSVSCANTVIDGYSQPGSSANTIADARNGSNAVPLIVIDGSGMTGGNLFTLLSTASGSTVRGLVLRNGAPGGSGLFNAASSAVIGGNFIGTDATGNACGSLSGPGIQNDFLASNSLIGSSAAADRNLIGCASPGIVNNGASAVQIKGNLIGVAIDGLTGLANSIGIGNANGFASVSVGGQGPGERNVIAKNTGSGVQLFSNTNGIVVSGNDIFLNGTLGIDQNADNLPQLPNTNLFPIGSNGSQNYPTITSVTYSGGATTISGTMQGFANSNNTLEFFSNDGTLGLDEGSRYAGTTSVPVFTTPPVPFSVAIPGIVYHPTATATASSGTSEFSPAYLTPDMAPSATSISFGTVPVGQSSAPQPLTIVNSGLAPLFVDSVARSLADYQDTTGGPPPNSAHWCGIGSDGTGAPLSGPSGISIAPGGACTMNLQFSPQNSGARNATLNIVDANSPASNLAISLLGSGSVTPPTLLWSFSPTSVVQGSAPSPTLSLTINNPNGAPFTSTGFGASLPAGLVADNPTGVVNPVVPCAGALFTSPGSASWSISSLSVPTSGSCTFSFNVSTAAPPGNYSVSSPAGLISGNVLSAAVSSAASNTATLAVNAAALSLSPTSLGFGTVTVGQSVTQPVTLTNTGGAQLNFAAPFAVTGANAADFSLADTCLPDPIASLSPSASCTVNVTFTPSAVGSRAASILFDSNSPSSPDILNLTGAGSPVPVPVVSLTPTSMLFSPQTVGTTSGPQPASLTNVGTANLNISNIVTSGDFAQSSGCPSVLSPTVSCTISVTFTPLISGLRTGDLKVFSDAAGSPHTVVLDGDGVLPPVPTVSAPSTVSFPTTQVGGTSAPVTITISNTGGGPLAITAAEIVGGGFAKVSDGCTGSSVPPSGNCAVAVTFSPTGAGANVASLRILSNAPTSPNFASLSGTGSVAPVGTLSSAPASVTFNSQVVGTTSSPQPVVITNTGSEPVSVSAVNTTGDFAQTHNCASVAGGGSCTVNVTFTPVVTGSRTGALSVVSNASNSPLTVNLAGTGAPIPAPVIELSTAALSFGNRVIGSASTSQSFTLKNTGGAPLAIASLALVGDFAVSNGCPATVAVGASCRIDVSFAPRIPGPRTGRLSVFSNAVNGTQFVDLTGTGCRFTFLNRSHTLICQ